MVTPIANLTYRTADNTRWGGGQGANLTSVQIDQNNWTLYEAIVALQSAVNAGSFATISYITQNAPTQFTITMSNHAVFGPFTLPTATFTPRGQWQPSTQYQVLDLVAEDGNLYMVTVAHLSDTSFNAFKTINTSTVYALLLAQPADELPAGGTVGQRLVKSSGSPYATEWESDYIRMAFYAPGVPTSNQRVLKYQVADPMTLPIGLTGSQFGNDTNPVAAAVWSILYNGVPAGTISFATSGTVTVSFATAINCVPGDVISVQAPGAPDTTQSGVNMTLIGQLTA